MGEQQQKFALYLEEQIAACKERGRLLAADARMDEGNFEKIRANVSAITQLTPAAFMAMGACSLLEPQPKFFSATIISPVFTSLINSLSISSIQ